MNTPSDSSEHLLSAIYSFSAALTGANSLEEIYAAAAGALRISPHEAQFADAIGGLAAFAIERLRVEDELRSSRDQLSVILAGIADGITVQEPGGRLLFANAVAARMLGFSSPDELLRTPVRQVMQRFELMDEEGLPFPVDRLPGRLALQGASTPEMVVGFRVLATAEERWSIVRATPVFGPGGQVQMAINIFTDITALKQAEQRLKQAETRYRRLVEQLPAVTYMAALDRNASTLYISPQCEQLLGHPPEAWIADPELWVRHLHPDDRERVLAHFADTFAAARPFSVEYRMFRHDGRLIWVRDEGALVRDDQGEPAFVQGILLDISAHKQFEQALRQSEQRYRTLADAMPQIVWISRPDGTMEYYNRRWFDYTGVAPEQALETAWVATVHAEDLQRTTADWTAALESGEVYEAELRLRRADGVYRWHLARGLPLRDDDGHISAWIGTSTDIEEQKRAEERQRFVAEAATQLSASLEYQATLSAVAAMAVPRIADWCVIHVVEADGALRRIAIAHQDAEKVRLAWEMDRRLPSRQDSPYGPANVARTGQPELVTNVGPEIIAAQAQDDEQLRGLQQAGFTSYMCVPMNTRGTIIGTITLAAAESAYHYGPEDLALAEELATHAAAAIDNARLYEAEQSARRAAERNAQLIARLQALTAALSGAMTPGEVADVVLNQGLGGLSAAAGSLGLVGDDGATVEIVSTKGYPPELIEQWRSFPLDSDVPIAEAIRSGQPVWLTGLDQTLGRYRQIEEAQRVTGNRATASLPLVVEERAIGALGISFATPRLFDDEDRTFLLGLARQCAQALERTRLYEAERGARAEAERAQQRLLFLAQASEALGASLDFEATLSNLARLAVPQMADWCLVDLVEGDWSVSRVAAVHAASGEEELAAQLRERFAPNLVDNNTVGRVLRNGRAELYPDVDQPALALLAGDDEHLELLRRLDIRSAIVVPLVARGRTLGAISLFTAASERRYSLVDLSLAGDLARRAALAVDNARLYRDAQEAVRVREDFVSIASHELRTPITVVQGYAQALLRQVRKAAARNHEDGEQATIELDRRRLVSSLEKIESAVARLGGLAGELLDVTRMQNRTLNIAPQHINLSSLLRGAIDSVRVKHGFEGRAGVALWLELPREGAVWGHWDRMRLEQVLLNLLDNAIKYSHSSGEIVISLALEEHAEAGRSARQAHIAVRDEGIGIPPDQLDQVFQPFTRGSNASARNFPGLGLGLALSKEIVDQHGGRIWVESDGVDRGSTFHIVLPGAELKPDA